MTRKRDFYRFPPVHTMITGAEKDCDGGPNSPHLRCTAVLFCWCGKFLWGGKTVVITWHTLGSPIDKPRKGHLEGVPQPLLEAY